jgi:hypothetical protein
MEPDLYQVIVPTLLCWTIFCVGTLLGGRKGGKDIIFHGRGVTVLSQVCEHMSISSSSRG